MAKDPLDTIQSKWTPSHRWNNYGNAITRISIEGFRSHDKTIIDVESPITAICGLNGTGKSTILQLMAVAYRHTRFMLQYNIVHFLKKSVLDSSPYQPGAVLQFQYWQADSKAMTLTISRRHETSRWSGYSRRPERAVLYAPISFYLPKVEDNDIFARNAERIVRASSANVDPDVVQWTGRILGVNYDEINNNAVQYGTKQGKLNSARRGTSDYSEHNMGYGEGRTLKMIETLYGLPNKSLILIEEPENSLHPAAQISFGEFLVDLVNRKGHQVILSTHSEHILATLPSPSRIYLDRREKGVTPILRVTPLMVRSLLSGSREKSCTILVEDKAAKILLSEILRKQDPSLASMFGIQPVGGAEQILGAADILANSKIRVAAVLDGDKRGDIEQYKEHAKRLGKQSLSITCLMGDLAPEKMLLQGDQIGLHFKNEYKVDLPGFLAEVIGEDHHRWFNILSHKVSAPEEVLITEASRIFLSSRPEAELAQITELLKAIIS